MAFEDLMPGKAKKRALKTKEGEIPPPAPAPALEPIVEKMRVRILRRITSRRFGTFNAGQVATLSVTDAKDLIAMGLAEQDKMLDAAPETK